ncbi:MAG: zinc-finger domain-containing protein [Candidatus Micropelagos thuwalensis]
MASKLTPKFKNDKGVKEITIGVREFECIGASAPYDHPHIFLDMGQDSNIICPYCSTVYKYDSSLTATQTVPEGCALETESV